MSCPDAVRKNHRVCTQAHTVVSIESDYQYVTTTVDPRSSQATVNNKLNKNIFCLVDAWNAAW